MSIQQKLYALTVQGRVKQFVGGSTSASVEVIAKQVYGQIFIVSQKRQNHSVAQNVICRIPNKLDYEIIDIFNDS